MSESVAGQPSAVDLPPELRAWVTRVSGAEVVAAARHYAGASREAWQIEVAAPSGRSGPTRNAKGGVDAATARAGAKAGGPPRPLFLLKDKGEGGGSRRDAGVLRALAGQSIPVPEVVGLEAEPPMILLSRVPGRSDFPAVDREEEREPTARHLMELTARLHGLEVRSLEIDHLERPEHAGDAARAALTQARGALSVLGEDADPFFAFALNWLESNIPEKEVRICLVHSDMGPGNFLYAGGRVTGIVDWEVAHYGDPMEDLAAIAVRDMATPIGDLPTRFREYEAISGEPVDLPRIHFYRALVLVRNSLMIGLGLAQPAPGFDVVEMTMYQTLLMRAAALVICDNLGLARPRAEDALAGRDLGESDGGQGMRAVFVGALQQALGREFAPAAAGGQVARVLASVDRGLATLAHEARIGPALSECERVDLAELLTLLREPDAMATTALDVLEARLRAHLDPSGEAPGIEEGAPRLSHTARYFARRMHRLAERNRPLMGELFERLPQPLSAAAPAGGAPS